LIAVVAGSIILATSVWLAYRPRPARVATNSTETAAPIERNRIEMMQCWFAVPTGRDARCGVLTVPEQWDEVQARLLHLRFVVFRGSDRSEADPIVYLAGGPGEPAGIDEASISRWWDWIRRANWLGKRDLVVFDYRGAGLSEPNMNCPELAEAAYRVFGKARSVAEAKQEWSTAASRCRDRLQETGIDLASYRTEIIAEDLHSLLEHLGYRSWDFLAVSYGTRVALDFVGRWPEGTRAVILDSVYPPNTSAYAESGRAAADAFAALFSECNQDRNCREEFPQLAETFRQLLRHAATAPVSVGLRVVEGQELRLDAAELTDALLQAFYDWREIAGLPATIAEASEGDTRLLQPLVQRALDTYTSTRISHGLFFSVECADEFPLSAPDDIGRAAAALPLFSDFIISNLPLTVCPSWPVVGTAATTPPTAGREVPMLMLSGELDPITPPDWAKRAAQSLPRATQIRFRGVGHGVLAAHDCAGLIVGRFLDNPARPPLDNCLLAVGPPAFRTDAKRH
jgi:pimeloyl-ACP methyl ester carboxylesterase